MTNPEIDSNGNQYWINTDSQYHRIDGPAIIYQDNTQIWLFDDEIHRVDGPAVIYFDRTCRWYVNNQWIQSNKEFQEAANLSDEEMTLIILKYGNVE